MMEDVRAWLLWCIKQALEVAEEACGPEHLQLRTVAFDKALVYSMSRYRPDGEEYQLEVQKEEARNGTAATRAKIEQAAGSVPAGE